MSMLFKTTNIKTQAKQKIRMLGNYNCIIYFKYKFLLREDSISALLHHLLYLQTWTKLPSLDNCRERLAAKTSVVQGANVTAFI